MDNKKKGNNGRRMFVIALVAFVIFVAALGVLWVTSLPKLVVSPDSITIDNCDPPLPTYAIGVCPKLHCKKLIMESGQFPEQLHIGFVKAKPSPDQVLLGSIRYVEASSGAPALKHFECKLEGYDVRELKILDEPVFGTD